MDNRVFLDNFPSKDFITIKIEGNIKASKKKKFPKISESKKEKILTEMINVVNYLFRIVFNEDISYSFTGNFSHNIIKITMPDKKYYKYFINIDFTQS